MLTIDRPCARSYPLLVSKTHSLRYPIFHTNQRLRWHHALVTSCANFTIFHYSDHTSTILMTSFRCAYQSSTRWTCTYLLLHIHVYIAICLYNSYSRYTQYTTNYTVHHQNIVICEQILPQLNKYLSLVCYRLPWLPRR